MSVLRSTQQWEGSVPTPCRILQHGKLDLYSSVSVEAAITLQGTCSRRGSYYKLCLYSVGVKEETFLLGRFEENVESKYLALKRTGEKEVAQGGLPVNTEAFTFGKQSLLAYVRKRHRRFLERGYYGFHLKRQKNTSSACCGKGKRRLSSVLVQGKFKKKISFRDVLTGQEFCHPVKSPGYFITKAAFALFKTLSPSMEANIVAENEKEMIPNATHFMSPMAATASVVAHCHSRDFLFCGKAKTSMMRDRLIINISKDEKSAPTLSTTARIQEDMRALGGELADSFTKYPDMERRIIWRKKYFNKITNLEKFSFDTDVIYTFDFYNDKLILEDLRLAILGKRFDLTSYLAGQPLRIMAKVRGSTQYLWNFELWHERQTESWDRTKSDKVVTGGTPSPSQVTSPKS
eukprot:jgi/Bigna1/83658/fgenesh1_pg.112_\